jgi:hypothetical protein
MRDLRGGRSDHVVLAADDPADLHPPAGTAVTRRAGSF